MKELLGVHNQMIIQSGKMRKIAHDSGELVSAKTMVKIWEAVAAIEEDATALLDEIDNLAVSASTSISH